MLADDIATNKTAIIRCWQRSVTGTVDPEGAAPSEVLNSLPHLIDEIVEALRAAASGRPGGTARAAEVATVHGSQRFHAGFSLRAVVREYGLLTLCLLGFARDHGVAVNDRETAAIVDLVNNAIADAGEQFQQERDRTIEKQRDEHYAFVAHELRGPLTSAALAAHSLARRPGGGEDATVQRLARGLARLRHLIDTSLVSIRTRHLDPDRDVDKQPIELRRLVDEVRSDLEGDVAEKAISIEVDGAATVVGDARLLRSAVVNLIGNAVKYTRPGGAIAIRLRTGQHLASIEVEDECGGLPEGKVEELFTPFVQRGTDRSGFGLGLSITKDAIDAHHGTVQASNLPGRGCIFMLSLPLDVAR